MRPTTQATDEAQGRQALGKVGVWSGRLQRRPTAAALELASEWDELGFGGLWVPESPAGKDVLVFATILLGATPRIPVATGIANIWVRDPVAMAGARRAIGDAFAGRFVLGVGVSHASTVDGRGHRYAKPLAAMRSYLEAMHAAPFDGHPPPTEPPIVLAALGPRMIGVAAELADGIHPFLTTPDHTASARQLLGDGLIAVEQGVVLAADLSAARATARANLARYLAWPNYRNHFLRSGFSDDDLADGGSDRLLDATYALGGIEAVRRRVQEHLAAGADHVAIQIVDADLDEADAFRALAEALLD